MKKVNKACFIALLLISMITSVAISCLFINYCVCVQSKHHEVTAENCEDEHHCDEHCEELGAQIALASGTYYKNGSSFFTLNSATQHYHCTNSQHSGTNDYTTSSVSGTCYTTTDRAGWSQQYYGHSCSTQYGEHNVSVGGYNGPHHYVKIYSGRGLKRYKCSYCNDQVQLYASDSHYSSDEYDDGSCGSNWITTYTCTICGASNTTGISGTCYSNITGYKCSYCNVTFGSNTTDPCSSRPWKKCDVCSSNWDACSCTVQNPHNHTIATYYMLYSYTNIDTNATVTSQTAYAQATGFTVVFNINNANAVVTTGTTGGTMANQYMLHGHSETIRTNAFTFSGHRFAGWATSPGTSSSPSSVVYTNSQAISLTTSNVASGGTLNLYAVWQYEVAKPTHTGGNTSDVYNHGANIVHGVTNYVANYMTRSGTYEATTVGTYSMTFTLKTGYCWSDDTTSPVTLTWNIVPRNISDGIITIPQTDYPYDGTVHKP